MFTTNKFLAKLLEGEEQTIEAIEIQLSDPDLTQRQRETLSLLQAGYMVRREQLRIAIAEQARPLPSLQAR